MPAQTDDLHIVAESLLSTPTHPRKNSNTRKERDLHGFSHFMTALPLLYSPDRLIQERLSSDEAPITSSCRTRHSNVSECLACCSRVLPGSTEQFSMDMGKN